MACWRMNNGRASFHCPLVCKSRQSSGCCCNSSCRMSMNRFAREPPPLGGGGSALLLSLNDPPLRWARKPSEFARCYFQHGLCCGYILDDKRPFDSSSTNVASDCFRLNQFIQLPAMQLLGRPDPVFPALPIEQLVVSTRNAVHLIDWRHRLDHFAHLAGNGHGIVGVRFGQIKHLDALVLGLIPIGDHYPLDPELLAKC